VWSLIIIVIIKIPLLFPNFDGTLGNIIYIYIHTHTQSAVGCIHENLT
jgi:hypothetical protein